MDSKLRFAFKSYENKTTSIYGAANIAGLNYKEFINKMIENNIKVDFDSIGEDINKFVTITKGSKHK